MKNYWLNVCLVVPALLIAGATMALLYLLVPLFFAAFAGIYGLRFAVEIWFWRKLSPDERTEIGSPCRFMNYNHVLSVKMEWLFFAAGFWALVLWIEYVQSSCC